MCVRGLLHLEPPALYDGCGWGKRVWQRFAEKCAIWATWIQFSIIGSDSVHLGGTHNWDGQLFLALRYAAAALLQTAQVSRFETRICNTTRQTGRLSLRRIAAT